MKRLIIILLLFGCGNKEDGIKPMPEPDSFCIYQRPPTSTNGQQAGQTIPWPFVSCVQNPYHTLHSGYKGHQSVGCKCRDFY